MLKKQGQQILTFLAKILAFFYQVALTRIIKARDFVKSRITSWGQIILIAVAAIIFLYYPIGGVMIHDIDTSFSYQPNNKNNKLAIVDMSAHLINREVYHKLWTPSLPFLFPSYFLDDMPNFQQGLMSSLNQTIAALSKLSLVSASDTARQNLTQATELLNYPGNVWLFSPQNRLIPAPSSATQYKKARKNLKTFNREAEEGRVMLEKTPQNLSAILRAIAKDINKTIATNETFIRENKNVFISFKADDTFYFTKGKLYAYAQILKALALDFKQVLIDENIYEQWVSAQKSLEQATELNPTIVRNGDLNASFAPNHIITINYFAARAFSKLKNMTSKLDNNS